MSQEESLYDLLHNERVNALKNSEKFLAAVEYFKGREDIVQARMAYIKEKGQEALLTEEDFQRIIEESKENVKLPEGCSQVYVWEGVEIKENEIPEFEAWMKETFNVTGHYLETIITFPDIEDGKPVPDTGGRSDVFFTVENSGPHNVNPQFSIKRLDYGMRYIEDVLSDINEYYKNPIYPERVKKYCSW